ncbi:MAG: hypothetical protein ACOCV8_02980, partial [Spirochaetota bacterium]
DILFNMSRLWRFLIAFIICFLYFTLDEFAFRTELVFNKTGGITYIKSFISSLLMKALILTGIILLSTFYFSINEELIFKFSFIYGLLAILMQVFSLYLFKKYKSYYLNGFINAFVFAWVFSMLLPLT